MEEATTIEDIMPRPHHSGTVQESLDSGSRTIHVFCLGMVGEQRCHYMASVKIADLPRVTWKEAQDRMLCPRCGLRGEVQIRFNHQECYEGLGRACNIIDGKIIP